jgi:hypothetical protein
MGRLFLRKTIMGAININNARSANYNQPVIGLKVTNSLCLLFDFPPHQANITPSIVKNIVLPS